VARRILLFALVGLLAGCADSKAVNAAFSQSRVSWFIFDSTRTDGLKPIQGFEQAQKVVWQPRDRAVLVTDLAAAPGMPGAAAVAGLGLLLLDDTDGTLRTLRPGASLPLVAYRTGRLFVWKDKLFLTLTQGDPPVLPPATLAWWSPGQSRLAFYPVPSQVQQPSRQMLTSEPPAPGSSLVSFTWKQRQEQGWVTVPGTFDLANGSEGSPPGSPLPPVVLGNEYGAVRARLSERLGTEVPAQALRGPGTVVLYTAGGWVSVGKVGEGQARLYRLPDLGTAGRYTLALALSRGFVFAWETTYRGFSGAAGLVHVPFHVLGP